MKDVGTGLENYLNTEKHMTSCDLFELRLPDGGVYYYTDADKDILYDGHNYRHDVLLIKRQQVKVNDSVVVDTLSVNIKADKTAKIGSTPLLKAAHDGTLDMSKLYLRRCFFRDAVVIGAIGLFGGKVEVKSCGGLGLDLTVKAVTQGLSQEFPVRKYYPQGTYSTKGGTITASTDSTA
ncbi:baseplate hub protein, partial [Phascolarctobacterium succinatutens]|uniref:baseplate hub domain-containing protein n=1 Tax=Phascolarctobacterium succinatutens TaxID=626940 RepID=UPI00307A572F